jgi:predicted O-methyltransferase YrrM
MEWRAMPHSFDRLVGSDWADKAEDDPVFGIYKKCGVLCREEAAILYHVAMRAGPARGREWLDIGGHTGWSTAHIAAGASAGNAITIAVDPMYANFEFRQRTGSNLGAACCGEVILRPDTSRAYFDYPVSNPRLLCGVMIDGDHSVGEPLFDAMHSAARLTTPGALVFHDFIGKPVRDAVRAMMDDAKMKCRIYWTPHVMAVCWKGDFTPPDHVADPNILALHLEDRMPDFAEYFPRCV